MGVRNSGGTNVNPPDAKKYEYAEYAPRYITNILAGNKLIG